MPLHGCRAAVALSLLQLPTLITDLFTRALGRVLTTPAAANLQWAPARAPPTQPVGPTPPAASALPVRAAAGLGQACREGMVCENVCVLPAAPQLLATSSDLTLLLQHRTQEPSREALEQLMNMGFDRSRAAQALRQTNNNVELAVQLLL